MHPHKSSKAKEAVAAQKLDALVVGRRKLVSRVAIILFAMGLVASVARIVTYHQTPGKFNPKMQGYCDFHNGVYFPSMAFRDCVSPYSVEYVDAYPTERQIPFYSPMILALHSPLTWLPLQVAEVIYFLWSLTLLCFVAYLAMRWSTPQGKENRWEIFWVTAAWLLLSRSGQQTIFAGYFTFELVVAGLVAVHFGKTKPWLSALGLAIISAKPTYVLPIAGLMLFRGNFKSVILGAIISIIGAGLSFGWLAQERTLTQIQADIELTQDIHRADDYEMPVNSWTRIDLLAIYAKWTNWAPGDLVHLATMILILLPAAIALAVYHRHCEDDGEISGLSGAVVMTTSLIAIYNQVYDAMLLVPAAVAILVCQKTIWAKLNVRLRIVIVLCMLMPGLNYASSLLIINKLGIEGLLKQVVTSVNGIALTIACGLLVFVTFREAVAARRNIVQAEV